MFIDQETVRDLEIFQTRDGKPGVFQALDLTRTPGGSRALRFRFENPMSDPALIRQVQEGVSFLVSEEMEFGLDPVLIREVSAYVDSPWDVASRARGLRFFLESTFVSLGYRDLFQHARAGVSATQKLISQLLPFLERIAERGPPSEVLRPVENLLALIDRLRLEKLRITRRPWTLARADRYLRVERKADFQRFFALLYDLDALMAMAAAMGADVTVFDLNRERLLAMRSLGNNVTGLYPYQDAIKQAVAAADLLIGAVLKTGDRSPHVVTRSMVKTMSAGSVIVDISVDQGGCIETTHPTTYGDPTYVEEGVLHFTVTNIPGAVPRSASQALSAALLPYVHLMSQADWNKVPALQRGINIEAGSLIHPMLKESLA